MSGDQEQTEDELLQMVRARDPDPTDQRAPAFARRVASLASTDDGDGIVTTRRDARDLTRDPPSPLSRR